MKKLIAKLNQKRLEAFTLLEMLVVLLVIGVLILLFVPSLTKQQESINDKGNDAIIKVVQTQWQLYQLDNSEHAGKPIDLELLVDKEEYITNKQKEKYEAAIKTP